MPKVRKKFNPIKQAQKVSKYALKNLGVFRSLQRHEQGTCEIVNYKHCNPITVSKSVSSAISNLRHNWVVHIGAIGFNGFDRYLKSAVADIPHEVFQREIAESLDKQHRSFVEREINKDHLQDVVWLALPVGEELTEQEFGEFLENVGVL